jgi:hypothetical protein
VNLTVDISNLKCYWDSPAPITTPLYGAAFWSAVNAGSFNAALVNDGLAVSTAFNWNVAADTTITYDAGAGNTKDFRALDISVDTTGWGIPIVEYSDNGSSWTAVTNARALTSPGPTYNIKMGWSAAGVHRYWRMRKGSSTAFAYNFRELQWSEAGMVSPFITKYLVYNTASGTRRLFGAPIDAKALPTVTTQLDLSTIATKAVNPDGSGSVSLAFDVVAVAEGGVSAGISCGILQFYAGGALANPFVPEGEAIVTIAPGLNSNVTISTTANSSVFTGSSSAWSLGGITPVVPGRPRWLYNGAVGSWTIVHEDALATSIKRIKTPTGANINCTAALVAYVSGPSAAISRWVVYAYW